MMAYDLLKAGHIVAVTLWFGGMLSAALVLSYGGAEAVARFQTLDRQVTTAAMVAVWALGLAMAVSAGWLASGWMVAKLVCALALTAIHGIVSGRLRRAARTGATPTPRAARLALPAMMALLCAVVVLVVTKAF